MSAKNLGQVSALYIGPTPPTNIKQIWYDDTPSQRCHKVYDTNKAQWVIIDQKIISRITYSEITGLASSVGLAIGKYYAITDKGNVLALAITSTKVQYTDVSGNIVVDDLGVNRKYHVTSSNLLVDDVEGVFDETTRKLIFRFTDTETPNIDDYLLAKGQRSGNYKLLKYRLSRLISQDAGNSLGWRNGLYFSIKDAIANVLDRKGGLVSYDTYLTEILKQTSTLEKIAKNSQDLPAKIDDKISEATSSGRIFNKTLQDDPISYPTPVDVRRGDTLNMIVGKYNAWLKSFKTSKGISIGADYTEATTAQYVNTNDSVQSAIGKIMYWIRNISDYLKTAPTFKAKEFVNGKWDEMLVLPNEDLNKAIEKLQGQLNLLGISGVGRLTHATNYYDLKRGTLALYYKVAKNNEGGAVRLSSGKKEAGNNAWRETAVSLSGKGLSVVSDHFSSTDSTYTEYVGAYPDVLTKLTAADERGLVSSGSSIVYWTMKRGLHSLYGEKRTNRFGIVTSVLGVFNKGLIDNEVVGTNPFQPSQDNNSIIFAGVYGTVDLKSVEENTGSGGNFNELDLQENVIFTNLDWYGGVFDRLLVRGLVYNYLYDPIGKAGSTAPPFSRFRRNDEGAEKTTADIYLGYFDTFFHIDSGFRSASGTDALTRNDVIVLPPLPIYGQSVKILVSGRIEGDKTNRIAVRISDYMGKADHKMFKLANGKKVRQLSLSSNVLYEFIYTYEGWKCFSAQQNNEEYNE
nr:MAG TPA: hypothetical protein [Caudoviricetes sp.]